MDTLLVNHLFIFCSLALLGGALVLACIRVEERPSRRSDHPRDPLLEDLGTGYAEPRASSSFVAVQPPPAELLPCCGCGMAMIAIDWDPRSGRANEWHCPPCVELAQPAQEEACAATIRCDMEDELESPLTVRSPGFTDGLFGCDEGRDA